MRRKLNDAAADPIPIYFVSSDDGKTPVNSPVDFFINLWKNGVTEVVDEEPTVTAGSNGWHWWFPTASDLDTRGPMTVVAVGENCDPFPFTLEVRALSDAETDTLLANISSLSSSVASIIAALGAWTSTGTNTVLGAFRALTRKLAGSTPSDIGGTFDNTTDSLEAIRDRGDAAWITGIAGGIAGATASEVRIEMDANSTKLAAIKAKTDLIQNGSPLFIAPNSQFRSGSFNAVLSHGSDYTSDSGQLHSMRVGGIPDPLSAVWEFRHGRTVKYSIPATVTAEGSNWLIAAPITRTALDAIANGTYTHVFVTTHANDAKREVGSGKVIVN